MDLTIHLMLDALAWYHIGKSIRVLYQFFSFDQFLLNFVSSGNWHVKHDRVLNDDGKPSSFYNEYDR